MAHRRFEALAGSAVRPGLAALAFALVVLAACGAPTPPDPDPDPDLTITGIDPTVALPGQDVTIQGTGFSAGQVVSFAGIEATVVSQTPTAMVVRVPDAYGYPVVSVDDVSAERLLFVGSAYAGPTTLAGVQDALDGLAEGAALRIGAGTFGGTELVVDNRKLFGAGPASVLEATTDVRVLARGGTVAVLADLGVDADTVELGRGRLSTASTEPPPAAGAIVVDDVTLDATALTMAPGTHLDVTLRDVTASFATAVLSGPGASLTIVGGDLTADVMQLGPLADVVIEAAALTTVAGSLLAQVTGSSEVRGSTLTSADAIVFDVVGDVTVEDSQLTSLDTTVFQSTGGAIALGHTDVVAASLIGVAQRTIVLRAVDADTTTGDVVLQTMLGDVIVADSALTPAANVVLASPQGALALRDTDVVTTAGSAVLQATGPVVVGNASVQSATDIIVVSAEAGEIVVTGSLLTSGSSLIMQGSIDPYAGANGTLRLENNTALTAGGGLVIAGVSSDVVIAENGPLDGSSVIVQSTEAHVTLRANQRIESASDVLVEAAGAGGRLTAVDNLFVADDGAGTIVLETVAGQLTESGNTFTGTASFPNNE